jgi:hypothetical protein
MLLYGSAYYLSGRRGFFPVAERFIHVTGTRIYGGFAFWKLIALPLGLQLCFSIMPAPSRVRKNECFSVDYIVG